MLPREGGGARNGKRQCKSFLPAAVTVMSSGWSTKQTNLVVILATGKTFSGAA